MEFLDEEELDHSSVVANCRMNRERELTGTNSYTRDLGFDVLAFLSERIRAGREVTWLDLCCGSARALAQAQRRLETEHGSEAPVRIHGVDLVDRFHPEATRSGLSLHVRPIRDFQPTTQFDLVTCVHGLHYVGDKLKAIRLACSWLKPDGRFRASLDLQNLRLSDGKPAARSIARALRAQGLAYDGKRRLLSVDRNLELSLPFTFVGADDRAGPNSTGQPAVNSYYEAL
ncbi:MAG: class I SAM-dependent methyltransferase [Planctomycetota bacterium]